MGVDCEQFHPGLRSAEARRTLAGRAGADPDSAILLYAGRLAPEKNLSLLLAMMELLALRRDRDYQLWIAGTGCSEADLRMDAERRIPGRCRFLGHISDREELARLYANVDAFVHPNPEEPFGIAPLEAMAAGVPLIAPNRGGVTTYANERNAWLAVPTGRAFAAAVAHALGDEADRQARCGMARATALEYRWERAAGDYLRLYREIYERGRGITGAHQNPPRFLSTPGNWLGLEI